MDNTISDFEQAFVEWVKKLYPEQPIIPKHERTTFYISSQYPEQVFKNIVLAKGFFLSIKPIEGAIQALRILSENHKVYICTSPCSNNNTCVTEKIQWVEKYLGKEWIEKIITTHDKTLIRGDVLIDDSLEPKGILVPSWEHIIYEQQYNQNIKNRKRISWKNLNEEMLTSGLADLTAKAQRPGSGDQCK